MFRIKKKEMINNDSNDNEEKNDLLSPLDNNTTNLFNLIKYKLYIYPLSY